MPFSNVFDQIFDHRLARRTFSLGEEISKPLLAQFVSGWVTRLCHSITIEGKQIAALQTRLPKLIVHHRKKTQHHTATGKLLDRAVAAQ